MIALADRLAGVRDRIDAAARRAGRKPEDVALLAVTKDFPAATVVAAVAAGLTWIGENRAQELLSKATELAAAGGPMPEEWHFVGGIQRNKVAKLAPLVAVWHSVDRPEVADALARHAPGARTYVQVNVSGEPQKRGCRVEEAEGLVEGLRERHLVVEGLMTVPRLGDDPRPAFAELRELVRRLGVPGLSMGMSDDFEIAVEEGATIVRLGSALFGPRLH